MLIARTFSMVFLWKAAAYKGFVSLDGCEGVGWVRTENRRRQRLAAAGSLAREPSPPADTTP